MKHSRHETAFLNLVDSVLGMPKEELNRREAEYRQLVDANPHPSRSALEELPGKVNYLLGNDPAKWRRNIPTYAKVGYGSLYPGVDLVYYGNQRQLEYDFVVAPGGDPNAIKLEFDGADELAVDVQGDLLVRKADATVQLRRPLVYQDTNDGRLEISAAYVLDGLRVGFRIDDYNTGRPLVIDPVLTYSTRLGGAAGDATGLRGSACLAAHRRRHRGEGAAGCRPVARGMGCGTTGRDGTAMRGSGRPICRYNAGNLESLCR